MTLVTVWPLFICSCLLMVSVLLNKVENVSVALQQNIRDGWNNEWNGSINECTGSNNELRSVCVCVYLVSDPCVNVKWTRLNNRILTTWIIKHHWPNKLANGKLGARTSTVWLVISSFHWPNGPNKNSSYKYVKRCAVVWKIHNIYSCKWFWVHLVIRPRIETKVNTMLQRPYMNLWLGCKVFVCVCVCSLWSLLIYFVMWLWTFSIRLY